MLIVVAAATSLIFPFLLLTQTAEKLEPYFVDFTAESQIHFHHKSSPTSRKYLIESMSSGVGLFDYNGDGQLDIFFVNGAKLQDPMPSGSQPDKSSPEFWNRLYRGNPDGTFSDVTEQAGLKGKGYGMGVAVGDYDNDGHPDLYVTNLGQNQLYHNNGNGTFTDVTEQAGVQGSGWSTGALFIDYDRDGLLDLIVTRYVKWSFAMDIWCGARKPGYRAYCHPDQFQPITYLVFHNKGKGLFEDATEQTHFSKFAGKGLGIAMNDFDRDGWPDVFVANDSYPEQLFRNHHGIFEEVGTEKGVAYDADGRTFSGMGTDFADYDNDGWPDIFVNALARERYALFHNERGNFDYVSDSSGIGRASVTHSGWGAAFIDYDNDGWKDVFVGQGHVMDNIQLTQPEVHYLERPLLLHNDHGRFSDASVAAGSALETPRAVRGVAFGDIDNSGSVDVVMNCNNDSPVLLKNQNPSGNHWLMVNTQGTASNRDGIGALVHVISQSGVNQYAMVSTGSSYLSASDKRIHFGLGRDQVVKRLEISWPSGKLQTFQNVKADQILQAIEPR